MTPSHSEVPRIEVSSQLSPSNIGGGPRYHDITVTNHESAEISSVVVRFYTDEAEFLGEHALQEAIGPRKSSTFTRAVDTGEWSAGSMPKFVTLFVTLFIDAEGNVWRNETPPGRTQSALGGEA
jgi:hypothetical protein